MGAATCEASPGERACDGAPSGVRRIPAGFSAVRCVVSEMDAWLRCDDALRNYLRFRWADKPERADACRFRSDLRDPSDGGPHGERASYSRRDTSRRPYVTCA